MKRERITFRVYDDAVPRHIACSGQTAKALCELIDAGPKGRTAQECGGWAYRLAAYTWELRTRYGLVVETIREDHPGGWHGRHVLHTRVEVIAANEMQEAA